MYIMRDSICVTFLNSIVTCKFLKWQNSWNQLELMTSVTNVMAGTLQMLKKSVEKS